MIRCTVSPRSANARDEELVSRCACAPDFLGCRFGLILHKDEVMRGFNESGA
jgi:hypothetical protein